MLLFKPLEPKDFPTLFEWLQNPHVKQWWDDGDDTLEKVMKHYSGEEETVKRFILYKDRQAIGYFQYYIEEDSNLIGTDQFIAESDLLNQGIGTRALKDFIHLILREETPSKIIIDPIPDNHRAIRCYEKVGFVFQDIRTGWNGKPVYFMEIDLKNSPPDWLMLHNC